MIKSFEEKSLEACWRTGRCEKIRPDLRRRVLMKLEMMDAAKRLEDIANTPGSRLHPLKGKREGEYALSVNESWRIVFRYKSGDFYSVRLEQYH